MKKIFIALTVATSFLMIACNGGDKTQEEPKTTESGADTTATTQQPSQPTVV
jgi:hypothetical protein